MSITADHLQALVDRYELADDSNDIEGRVRAAKALLSFTVHLENRDTARAWQAIDRKRLP